MPTQKHKGFSNPLEQAMQTGIIGGGAPGIQVPENLGTQVTEGLGTQETNPLNTQETKGLSSQGIRYSGTQGIKGLGTQVPENRNARSSSIEYSRLGVYIRAELHRKLKAHAALTGRDISEIVEALIQDYIAGQERG